MEIVRTYDKGCEWCGATGQVYNHESMGTTAPLYVTCPVCNGTGKVTVTEKENSTEVKSNSRFSVYSKIEGKDLVGILRKRITS